MVHDRDVPRRLTHSDGRRLRSYAWTTGAIGPNLRAEASAKATIRPPIARTRLSIPCTPPDRNDLAEFDNMRCGRHLHPVPVQSNPLGPSQQCDREP